jgi:hypothetical protein
MYLTGNAATVYRYSGSGAVDSVTPTTPTGDDFSFSTALPSPTYIPNSVMATPPAWTDSQAVWITAVSPVTNAGVGATASSASASVVTGSSSTATSSSA